MLMICENNNIMVLGGFGKNGYFKFNFIIFEFNELAQNKYIKDFLILIFFFYLLYINIDF